jgi:fibronectin-binding autotransporter adhesin
MLFSPLRSLKNWVSRTSRRGGRPGTGRPRRRPDARLLLEKLEDRLAPATVNWSGGSTGLGTDWNDNTNWVGNARPTAADDAVIGSAFSAVTITASSDAAARSVTSSAALQIKGGTFALGTATSVINASLTVLGGSLRLSGTTLNGSGTLTNSADLQVSGGTVNTALSNQGTLEVQLGTSNFNGTFTNTSAGTVTVQAAVQAFADATLKVANDFTNEGVIVLTAGPNLVGTGASLTVTSGMLTNAAGGTINAAVGTGGGSRFLNAQLDNRGTINVNRPLTLAANSAAHLNSGTINAYQTVTINQSGASSSFTNSGAINLTGGDLILNQPTAATTFTNSGTVTISSTTLTVNGGEFDPASGTVNGAVQLNGVALGSGTLSSNAAVTLSAGSEVAAAALTNQGSLVILGINQFDGAFTNDVTGTLQVRGTSMFGTLFPGALTLTNGFTNNGLVELVAVGTNNSATLSVTAGTLTNAAGAVINVLSGFTGPRVISAQLDNEGTINVSYAGGLTLTHPNGTPAITNGGTINVNDGDLTVNQSGTTAVFVNTGTLNISAGRTLTINGGEFDPDSGSINGAVQLNGVALGSGTLSSNAAVTLSAGSQPANATLVNQGQLFIQGGTTTFNGSFTNGENGLLQLAGGVNNTSAVLTVANDLTNYGVIQLTARLGGVGTTLNVTSGTLTNAPGALLETLAGTGGTHTLNAQLDNQGTVNLSQRLTITRTAAAHTNSGVITVRADLTVNQLGATASFDNTGTINAVSGNVLFTQTGTQPSFTNAGEIDVAAGRTFTLDGGTFTNFADNTLTGGTYNLAGTFKFTDARILTNAATLVLDGSAAQIMDQANANALANLAVNSGAFTLKNGRSFTRTGDFSNTGNVTVLGTSTFTVNGTFSQTDGATTLGAGGTLTATGGVNLLGGVLSGSGTVNADVVNAGELDVGASGTPGVLTVNGNYTQTAAGVLNVEIGGSLPGTQFDQLVIAGQATLDGTLNVGLINSFSPAPGDSFKILTFAGSTGGFATANIDQGGTFVLNPTDGTVMFSQSPPGSGGSGHGHGKP